MTLTEFLEARIAEDEQACEAASDDGEWIGGRLVPLRARLLSECKVKRRLVEDYREACEANRSVAATDWPQGFGARPVIEKASYSALEHGALLALRRVAAVYADHPDFDESWRV